ncbi:hypothetical protein LCGC14_0849880 [marine sediment metagenome]|uniref:Uncharacterized protein n=1 Tax=marine sediment metagenome TaxID=412755 RepID=A0A0F9SHM5_9ZZZZ
MVSERLRFYRYPWGWPHYPHKDGACHGGYLSKKGGFIKSDRAYHVPSSISGSRYNNIVYCEECCYENGWLW